MHRSYKVMGDGNLGEVFPKDNSNDNPVYESSVGTILNKMIKKMPFDKEKLYAKDIMDEYFPAIDADVFISHSRKDNAWIGSFKNWLESTFGLKVFVDSDIWGYSNALIKELTPDPTINSIAHVHMILSYALTRMIDKTECFIFFQSNNSVTHEDSIKGTYSPWIFHELATAENIKIKDRDGKPIIGQESMMVNFSEDAQDIRYPILEKRLVQLSADKLKKWKQKWNDPEGEERIMVPSPTPYALDMLYNITPDV